MSWPSSIALWSRGAVAPQLWPLEMLNGLLTAERRGRLDASARVRMTRSLADPPIRIDEETAALAWTAISELAERHRLTANDAAYLELAHRLELPLATADDALATAAESAGVALLETS